VEINQYIKELLLLNDCVIIPQFGGFVANYKPATIENNKFFPPTKEVAFNNKLTSNDGLLINYISEIEDTDYFSAKQKLEDFVEETLLRLERSRKVYFEGIGYLHYDSRENLLFEPQLKQNLLVESYGLQSFSYEKLYHRQMPKPVVHIEHREAVPLAFPKRTARKMVVALPLLMAMALIPMKNTKEYLSKSDMGMWEALTQSVSVAPAQVKEEPVAEYKEIVKTPVIAEQFSYYLIGGSFKSEENANKYIEQLKALGYNGKNLGIFRGLHRVAIKGFSNMEDAKNELNLIRRQNTRTDAWIQAPE